jgi:hypothetical protein
MKTRRRCQQLRSCKQLHDMSMAETTHSRQQAFLYTFPRQAEWPMWAQGRHEFKGTGAGSVKQSSAWAMSVPRLSNADLLCAT